MTILVTGGTKGIGLALARRLARPSEPIVLNFHSDTNAAASAEAELAKTGALVTTVQANVGEIRGAQRVMDAVAATGGGPLRLVHSAAMIYPTALLDADLDRFNEAIQVNGLSLLYLVRAGLPLLTPGGSVVFISSSGARTVTPTYAAVGVGKALAESLVRYLVPELA